MYQNTRFQDVLKAIPRPFFRRLIQEHQSDKHCKGFGTWDQLLAMMYSQLAGCTSLREIEAGFNSQACHHYHLGTRSIKRSTLADANGKRDAAVFQALCEALMQQAHRSVRQEVSDLLYLIDSSGIPLKGPGFDDWAAGSSSGRIQGLKLHTVFSPDSATPTQADITHANINDVEMGKKVPIEAGATYVFDKGYYDYNWWYSIHQQGAFFVTRAKQNARLKLFENRAIPGSDQETVSLDEEVVFSQKPRCGRRENHYMGTPLRRVTVPREDGKKPLVLLTNDFERSAGEIAQLYKSRWGIELFFKWIKQNLRIKKFLGCSENAVRIQLYTALITYLLLAIKHQQQGAPGSLKMFIVELKSTLFQRPRLAWEKEKRRRKEVQLFQQLQGALPL